MESNVGKICGDMERRHLPVQIMYTKCDIVFTQEIVNCGGIPSGISKLTYVLTAGPWQGTEKVGQPLEIHVPVRR